MFTEIEFPFVRDIPESGDKYLEFQELDQDAERTIGEYLATSAYNLTKDQEKKVCDCILKYLLLNGSPFPERATETAISDQLGIPRSKLRKIMGLLEWEEIIESVPVGATQPYVVRDISKAFKQGYLNFTLVEGAKLSRILGGLGSQSYHPLPTILRSIHSTIPNEESIYKTREWVMEALKPMIQVQRPLGGGKGHRDSAVTSTSAIGTDRELVQKFIDHSLSNMPWPIVREVLFELGVPDKITRDQFLQGMRKVGEKYVKLALKITDPLARIVGEGGLTLGPIATDKSRHKEEMIAANPNSIHMFGDLLLDTPVNDPVRGYVGLQTQPITAQHVRLVANFVRAAGRLAVKVGAAKTVVEMAEKRARMLDDEAEKGYKAQGLILRIHGLRGEQSAKEALQLFEEAEQASLRHDHSWFWLGLTLYDGNHYEEAMQAFHRTAQITNERLYRAASWVWEGHLYDLMGNRENALKMYRKAIEEPFPGRMLHDQYGIAIDEEWVKKKLKQPFKRVEWKEKYLKDT